MGKQCRERWHNHLNPRIKKINWSSEEEWILFLMHRKHSNKWADIAKVLDGRTDNTIKNHWNSSMKRKLSEMSRALETYIDNFIAERYPTPEAEAEYANMSSKERLKIRKECEETTLEHYTQEA
jgi:hypothetical protein